MKRTRRSRPPVGMPSGFAGFRVPPEVIFVGGALVPPLRACPTVEELLAGIEVDHVTLYRWVQRFTPLLIDAARPVRHLAGDRWLVDETDAKVAGSGATYTGPSTSMARSSTCICRTVGTSGLRGRSSPLRCPSTVSLLRSSPTGLRRWPTWLRSWFLPRGITPQYENNRVVRTRPAQSLRHMRGMTTIRTASSRSEGTPSSRTYAAATTSHSRRRAAVPRPSFDELRPAI